MSNWVERRLRVMKPLRSLGNVFTQHGDENCGQIRLLEVQCIGSEQGNKVDVTNKRNNDYYRSSYLILK
jgi:hypothetical protein